MPAILIDISRLLYRRFANRLPTGVDRVSLEYLRRYNGVARAALSLGRFHIVLPRTASGRAFQQLTDPSGGPSHWRFIPQLFVAACIGFWSERNLVGAILFNTGHMGLGDSQYASSLRARGVRPVFMVHDLIPITHPEFCRPGEREKHWRRMHNVLRLSHGIVTNSEDTLASLTVFSKAVSLPMPPVLVAPLAPGLARVSPAARQIKEPYFVVLSTIEPRKNHSMLLHLWRRLREEMGEKAPRLVIIGQRGWECENVVDLLERSELLRGFVFELPRCNDSDLATYLHHAQALLFPSFVEGYGMPLIEALAAGVPVVASNLGVFREFAADIPEYVDPLDPQRWLALIKEYSSPESTKRAAQIDRMRTFELPTWDRHFALLDSLLLRLDSGTRKLER
ncbi:MAG: glycosyltransferase family 4 protein [Burkholderiales bacterium]|nr:glycosyltransferase family 4 protein [Burkholderiales bacterium]